MDDYNLRLRRFPAGLNAIDSLLLSSSPSMVGNEQGSRSHYTLTNNRLVDNLSSSFHVTNFPPNVDVKSLWDVCAKIGTVADVYMA